MKGHDSAGMNRKSVQAEPMLGHFSKSDVRYWQRAVFRQSYTRNGYSFLTKAWAMKVAYEGRRETFPLGTPLEAVIIPITLQRQGQRLIPAGFQIVGDDIQSVRE